MLEPEKDDDFCLKWNNHHRTFMNVLHGLMKKEILVDVTLAAEGKFIEAHKLVLCTCSEYFQDVLSIHDNKQAYIFLNNIAFDDLYALVEYMYRGEVNVSQEQLPRFIAAAEALKIKGLSDKAGAPAMSDNQDEEAAPQPRSKRSRTAAASSRRLNPPRIPNLSSPDMQQSQNQQQQSHHSFHEASGDDNIEEDQKMVSSLQLFAPSLQQHQDDNFISVNAIDQQDDDGLGTLDKVWSMGQENGHDWSEDRHQNKNNPQGDGFHANPPESDITDSSIDYQHFASASSSTINVDPSMGVPGIEEVLPGPSSSSAAVRTAKSFNYNSRHSTTVSSVPVVATAVSNDGSNRGKMVCPTCGRVYTQKGSLNRHLKFECGIIPKFACEICPMRFRRAYKLTEHYKRAHGGTG